MWSSYLLLVFLTGVPTISSDYESPNGKILWIYFFLALHSPGCSINVRRGLGSSSDLHSCSEFSGFGSSKELVEKGRGREEAMGLASESSLKDKTRLWEEYSEFA